MKHKKHFIITLCLLFTAIIAGVYILYPKDNVANTSSEAPSSSQTPAEPYVVSTATVINLGDLLMHEPIIKAAYIPETDSYDFSPCFSAISDYLKEADLAVANLEVTLGGQESGPYDGYPCFNLPDELADNIKDAGISMLLTANNHCYDTRVYGLKRTAQVLKQKNIDFIGTRETETEPLYTVKDVNGIKIGMACYTYENTSEDASVKSINGVKIKTEANALINSFNYDRLDSFYENVAQTIDGMYANGADCIVFYMHWGEEYQLSPNSWQKNIAQQLCNLGVDVIVGGHPHVVQPMEILTSTDGMRNTVCVYSLGNIISNQRKERTERCTTGHTEDGILFYYTFEKYSDGKTLLSGVEAIPTWVNVSKGENGSIFTIYALEGENDGTEKYTFAENTALQAAASYNRTKAQISESLAACQSFLTQNAVYCAGSVVY